MVKSVYRYFSNNKLRSWINKKCIQCGRFISNKIHEDCCNECTKKNKRLRAYIYENINKINVGDYV